jgi:putative ABC transport system permease protein
MWHDLRLSLRTLMKHRGFAALAAAVLGLGIGLNIAIFSIVYAMLWKPLPVAAPGELVYFYQVLPKQPDRPTVVSSYYYEEIRKHTDGFAGTTGHWGTAVSLRVDGQSDQVNVEWVFANYFELLGVRMALGRPFVAAEDDVANPERAIIISHALWSRRFGSDPNIIGREIVMNPWGRADEPWTVVGVAAPGFTGLSGPWSPTQAWTTFAQSSDAFRDRGIALAPIARLKPGVSLPQAQQMIAAVGHASWLARTGGHHPEYEPKYVVYRASDVRMPFDPSAAVIPVRLAGAMTIVVAMVLLVAATNVAGILLARGVGRSGEIAIRRVLGAGSLRIARQLLVETLLLALAGGVVGGLLGAWLLSLFRALTPVKYAIDVAMNGAVVWFAAVVCLATGTIVGVLPARQATRVDLLPALAGAGNVMTKQTAARARHAITIPQVACSLVLLLVAAVYVRALLGVELADIGYQTSNLVVAQPVLKPDPADRQPNAGPSTDERVAERARRLYRQVFERLRTVAGAADIAIADRLPLSVAVGRPNWAAATEAAFLAGDRSGAGTDTAGISPGYFRTLNIRLLRGRDFDDRDTRQAPNVAILSVALADRLWPGRDPLGQTLTLINTWSPNDKHEWYRVVGIVNEVSPILNDHGSRPLVYMPLAQQWRPSSGYAIVRGAGDSRLLIPAIKAAIESADSFAAVYRVTTLAQMAAEILYPRRIAGAVLALSGVIALLLATIGVYAVVSYAVAQRTGEIGVRMALGAERRDIIALVLREGRTVAALGSAGGLALGYAAIRITSNRYLSLPEIDIASLVATPVILCLVVLGACYLPARRAGRIDPMDVLRRS